MFWLLSSVYYILFNSTFASPIVKTLDIIYFSFFEKVSQMFLTHKITDVPNSQNTFKTQFLLSTFIQCALAFNFKYQPENMQITSSSLWKYGYSP